jgi:hypothetical protein
MQRGALTLAGLMFAQLISAQDLPPGVLLLSRVENHIKEEFQRLASITCLETAQREAGKSKDKLHPLDTVRLEVLTNGDQELFASPGDRRFSAQPPIAYAGSGMLGNGLFGPYLKNILLNGNATTKYKGEEDLAGRRLARYASQLSAAFSGQSIELPEGSGSVGLKGSFWVDPQTYDVIRLELNADDIPPSLPISALTTSVNYGRTVLTSQLTVLLPETADIQLVKNSGEISHDRVEFTHCRVFGAESTIDFNVSGVEQQARFGAVSLDDTLRGLPGGLQVAVKLRSRVSSDLAVGTLIDGVVAGDVKDKHAMVIPAGSPVRGRIRRMERYTDPFVYFVVGIEFTEVEVEGIRHIFYADLEEIDSAPGVELTLSTKNNGLDTPRDQLGGPGTVTTVTRERIVVHSLPGVATFFFKGDPLDLPPNFRTVWKTRALKE